MFDNLNITMDIGCYIKSYVEDSFCCELNHIKENEYKVDNINYLLLFYGIEKILTFDIIMKKDKNDIKINLL